jgi:hypothetical protein
MTCQLLAVCFDANQPLRLAQFWAGVLNREVGEDADGVLVSGEDSQLSLRFVPSGAEKVGPNRMHLHLTSANPAGQQHTVATAGDAAPRRVAGVVPQQGADAEARPPVTEEPYRDHAEVNTHPRRSDARLRRPRAVSGVYRSLTRREQRHYHPSMS